MKRKTIGLVAKILIPTCLKMLNVLEIILKVSIVTPICGLQIMSLQGYDFWETSKFNKPIISV